MVIARHILNRVAALQDALFFTDVLAIARGLAVLEPAAVKEYREASNTVPLGYLD